MTDIFWALPLILIGVAFLYFQERAARNRLREYLEKRKCQNIEIHRNLFVGGNGSFSFSVEYLDRHNVKQENNCMIYVSFLSPKENTFHWENPFQS